MFIFILKVNNLIILDVWYNGMERIIYAIIRDFLWLFCHGFVYYN